MAAPPRSPASPSAPPPPPDSPTPESRPTRGSCGSIDALVANSVQAKMRSTAIRQPGTACSASASRVTSKTIGRGGAVGSNNQGLGVDVQTHRRARLEVISPLGGHLGFGRLAIIPFAADLDGQRRRARDEV